MSISTVKGLYRYIRDNSNISAKTIRNLFITLGFHPLHSTKFDFYRLSNMLVNCTDYDSCEGYKRLFEFNDIDPFFKIHRRDIVAQMELDAYELETDIISYVQNYLLPRNRKTTVAEVSTALWDYEHYLPELKMLYNYFTHYILCEIAWIWCSYLEENPGI